jgi:hypothetical protein
VYVAVLNTDMMSFHEYLNRSDLQEMLKRVDGRWAFVSRKTGRVLAYYKGEGKPSDAWVAKQERRVQYFKHH